MAQELVPNPPVFQNIPILPTRRVVPDNSTKEWVEQILYLLFKRKWLILGLCAVFSVAGAVAVLTKPPVRIAIAKILLKPDRVSLQISELSPASKVMPPQALKSEVELLESRDVLLPVAEALIAEVAAKDEAAKAQGQPSPVAPEAVAKKTGADEAPVAAPEIERDPERLAMALADKTQPIAHAETSIIEVRYSGRTSQEAEKILGMIVNRYLQHHADAYGGSAKLLEFYEQEKKRAEEALAESERVRREWQEENQVISIDDQIKGLLDLQTRQQRGLQLARTDLAASIAENPLIGRLHGELASAEVALGDLRARYTDEDRRVREKQAQVSMIRDQIRAAEGSIQGSLKQQQKAIAGQIEQTSEALKSLRSKKVDGDQLARVVELNRNAYLLYGKKLEEARIAANLDEHQLSSLAMIERPHASSATDMDERIGIFLLATLAGLALGVFLAIGLAFFNKNLRTAQDVERYLELPVLATIPDLRSAT